MRCAEYIWAGEAVLRFAIALAASLVTAQNSSASPSASISERLDFEHATKGVWADLFFDPCVGDWTKKWFLDGEIGAVETSVKGMQLTAGPQFKNDAHHMVLWTRDTFVGDLKIEYEYTRLDFETRCVNILYIQASGTGEGLYVKDISAWSELRRVPAMSLYFDHMNTYHISYAAFPNEGDERVGYLRGRRYMPGQDGLSGTDLEPDYYPEGLFEPGIPHKITVIKRGNTLYMRVENSDQTAWFQMANPALPPVDEGRVGLRHMFTRSARYKNFRISVPVKKL